MIIIEREILGKKIPLTRPEHVKGIEKSKT
jgi:hypothetical protein